MSSTHPGRVDFEDFDHLTESLRAWDLDLKQLDRGKFFGHITQQVGRSCALTRARFDRVLEQRGSALPGAWTVGIPLANCRPFRWHGVEVHAGDLVLFPEGWELDCTSFGDFEVVTVSVACDTLASIAEARGICASKYFRSPSIVRRPLAHTAPLLEYIDRATRSLHHPDATLRASAARSLDEELPTRLLEHLACDWSGRPRAGALGVRMELKAALAFVHAHASEALSVSEVASATRVSTRTLRRIFDEHFGLSPKAYLQAQRLNRARQALHRSDPATARVADIAGRFGFWHMGKFASDYRRHFGELPSETLSAGGGTRTPDADPV